jgi:high-affinity iron transporter
MSIFRQSEWCPELRYLRATEGGAYVRQTFWAGSTAILVFREGLECISRLSGDHRQHAGFGSLTGVMLGVVLLVMVGEQAQEMQLAGWLPTTSISWLKNVIPDWVGLWFAIFPTVETLVSQLLAAALVLGSYFAARAGGAPAGAKP